MLQDGEEPNKLTTFPAQALSCSGSAGLISASPTVLWGGSTPGIAENVDRRDLDPMTGRRGKVSQRQLNFYRLV